MVDSFVGFVTGEVHHNLKVKLNLLLRIHSFDFDLNIFLQLVGRLAAVLCGRCGVAGIQVTFTGCVDSTERFVGFVIVTLVDIVTTFDSDIPASHLLGVIL